VAAEKLPPGPRKSWMEALKPADPKAPRAGSRQSLGVFKPDVRASQARGAAGGSGLTSDRMREQMVARLREGGIRDQAVLQAMGRVPRHGFVDEGLASRAYEDSALPIGHAQTISQPFIVARMSELLCARQVPARVLEVGTGCGYQAAVLAQVATEVYSIERIRALHDRARANLRPLRIANLRLVFGDGMQGVPSAAPFDGILVAAAANELPRPLLEQMAIGGRMVAPVGGARQSLRLIIRNSENDWSDQELEQVLFVPLRSGTI